jgi:hypothetical protein
MNLLRRLRYSLMLCALVCAPAWVHAVTVEDLYEVVQPVETSQDAAFAEALRTVVVKVSGLRDAPNRLGGALSNPRQFVQRYGVTQQNLLQVGFDNLSIDRLLSEAGLPIWGRERPATLVVLALDEAGGAWLSGDAASVDKERVEKAARERGLPLLWGALDGQDHSALSAGAGSAASWAQIAARNGANAVLVGRGSRNGAVHWTLATTDGVQQRNGALEDGVHLAADAFAAVFAATGSSLREVTVDVSGITDLNAYARTLNYLEQMTLVRAVGVEQVVGDTLRLKLGVRGDVQTLRRALALDNRLVPAHADTDPAAAAGDRLALRYQP